MSALASSSPGTGFSFKHCLRNTVLEKLNIKAPQPYKTGTTISGVVFKDGVVLGADSRATDTPLILDSQSRKIHFLADNIYCCGAGVAADAEVLTQIISSNLELLSLNTERPPRVRAATRMMKQVLFRHHGNLNAALLIGGVDVTGPHIACVYPYGSSDVLPFATMGSGSLAAMAVLETGYKQSMELNSAKNLVRESILAGIDNDLGSGARIDLCVIQREEHTRKPHKTIYVKGERQNFYAYEPGTTSFINETEERLEPEITECKIFPIDSDEDEDDI